MNEYKCNYKIGQDIKIDGKFHKIYAIQFSKDSVNYQVWNLKDEYEWYSERQVDYFIYISKN